jgi:16S rRNA (uracil1498-N3)-methyltransferase
VGRAHHRRFLVAPEALASGEVVFRPDQARQIVSVLRLGAGDEVSVFDGAGREWTARLTVARPREARGALVGERSEETPPCLRLTLAQVAPRGAAMDLIVAKATELGVWRIVSLEAEHSVRRETAAGREVRWRRIVAEAAEQSGRRRVPAVESPQPLAAYLASRPVDEPLLVCDAGAGAEPLPRACGALAAHPALTILVGGEGGLSAGEVACAIAHGGRRVALGPRLLRAETAALAALAIVQAWLGDWDAEHPHRG